MEKKRKAEEKRARRNERKAEGYVAPQISNDPRFEDPEFDQPSTEESTLEDSSSA